MVTRLSFWFCNLGTNGQLSPQHSVFQVFLPKSHDTECYAISPTVKTSIRTYDIINFCHVSIVNWRRRTSWTVIDWRLNRPRHSVRPKHWSPYSFYIIIRVSAKRLPSVIHVLRCWWIVVVSIIAKYERLVNENARNKLVSGLFENIVNFLDFILK